MNTYSGIQISRVLIFVALRKNFLNDHECEQTNQNPNSNLNTSIMFTSHCHQSNQTKTCTVTQQQLKREKSSKWYKLKDINVCMCSMNSMCLDATYFVTQQPPNKRWAWYWCLRDGTKTATLVSSIKFHCRWRKNEATLLIWVNSLHILQCFYSAV